MLFRSGELYVADGGTHQRVVVFDAATGAFKRQWRGHGAEFQRVSSIAVSKDGQVYVGDRSNKRVQIFSPDGEFIDMWTGMSGPNHVARGTDGLFYITEQKADGHPGFISIRNENGKVLARFPTRHGHGLCVDSRGDIYTGSTSNNTVDKYVRVR